jgi:hypothetical protein
LVEFEAKLGYVGDQRIRNVHKVTSNVDGIPVDGSDFFGSIGIEACAK